MTGAAGHEQINHALGLGGEVGALGGEGVDGCGSRGIGASAEKVGKGDGAQAYAALFEEPAAGDEFAVFLLQLLM